MLLTNRGMKEKGPSFQSCSMVSPQSQPQSPRLLGEVQVEDRSTDVTGMKTVVECMRSDVTPQVERLNSFLPKEKRSGKRKTEVKLTQEQGPVTEAPLDAGVCTYHLTFSPLSQ